MFVSFSFVIITMAAKNYCFLNQESFIQRHLCLDINKCSLFLSSRCLSDIACEK